MKNTKKKYLLIKYLKEDFGIEINDEELIKTLLPLLLDSARTEIMDLI